MSGHSHNHHHNSTVNISHNSTLNISDKAFGSADTKNNPPVQNVSIYTEKVDGFDRAEMVWILCCVGLAWIIIPGIGLFYNGMGSKKNALSVSMSCLWACAVVSIQWYVIGASLVMSRTGGPIIGNFDHVFFMNMGATPAVLNPRVPESLIAVVFGLFAAITPCVMLGATAERARIIPFIVFMFFWSTLVFDFVMYWEWNVNGWIAKEGGLDFGGGSIVHVTTGFSSLAYALILGKRKKPIEVPHNMSHVYLGGSLIWFAWLIANAVSGLSANLRTVSVLICTNLSASVGGITWTVLDFRKEGKLSTMSFISGAVAGLVAITPGSGFVSPAASILFGFIAPVFCRITVGCKHFIRIDDAFDVFGVHGAGGVLGAVLTGIFAQKSVASLDGTEIEGGWMDRNWIQPVMQLTDSLACGSWSFFVTLILVFIIDKIPGLKLRVTEEVEENGLDDDEFGDVLYQFVNDGDDLKNILKKSGVITVTPINSGGEKMVEKMKATTNYSEYDVGISPLHTILPD